MKYLCKTTIPDCNGGVRFKYGLVYEGKDRMGNGRSIEETVKSGDSCDGSHNAFELVKLEWPRPVTVDASSGQLIWVRHHASGSRARLNFGGRIIERDGVETIHEFTREWLEAAESDAT